VNIRRASRIAELADDWRATLTHRSIFSIPEWLVTDEAGELRYLLCGADGAGTGLIVRRVAEGGFFANDPFALLLGTELDDTLDPVAHKDIARLRARVADRLTYPVATATLSGGYLPGLIGERRPDAMTALLDELDATAAEWGCPATAVTHVPDGDPLADELTGRDYVGAAALAQAEIDVRWPSFADYLATRSRGRRANIRRERREFAEAGLVLREDKIGARATEMAELHLEQLRRYGHDTISAEWMHGLMDRITTHLEPSCRVLVAERDGRLEAFALAYEHGGELHVKMTGFSAYAQKHFGYFNLTYYAAIDYAMAHGLRTIVCGPMSYAAKVARGAVLAPRSTYLRVAADLRAELAELAAALDRYNHAAFAGVR